MNVLQRLKLARGFLLTKLNAIGSILLAYALLNPTAANDLLNLLPPKLKIPAALTLPALWFCTVQYAKARAIAASKKATAPSVGGRPDAQ